MEEPEAAGLLTEAEASVESRPRLPTLDLGRLAQRGDDPPLHQQQEAVQNQRPPEQQPFRGPANPPPKKCLRNANKLRLARLSHLDGFTKAKVSRSVQNAEVKSWLHAHGYVVKADKLHPAVTRVIAEWFQLVDDDNSRTLEHHELLAALKAAHVPCDDATIKEMIGLMDINKDGVIDWDEFEVFMTEEFAAGKSLLSGEYLLPSGLSINFGVMVGKLKRSKLLSDIMEDTRQRNKWAAIASNPDALVRELATMQEAVEATSLTLEHLKRSENNGMGGNSPRARLAAALLRATAETRRAAAASPPRQEGPGRTLRERLRATALGLDAARAAQAADTQSGSSSPQRPFPDPTALPAASAQPFDTDSGLYVISSSDPLMPPPQPGVAFSSCTASPCPGSGAWGQAGGSRCPTPGIGAFGAGAASAAAGAFSPVPSPPQVATYYTSNPGASTSLPSLPVRAPERCGGPTTSAPLHSYSGAGAGAGATAVLTTTSSFYPTSRKGLVDWSAAPAAAATAYQSMRVSDQPGKSGPAGPRSQPLPTAAATYQTGNVRRSSTTGFGGPIAPTAGIGGIRRNNSPAHAEQYQQKYYQQYHQQQQRPGEPQYATSQPTATISAAQQPQRRVSRTISQVGFMAQELRAAAGRLPPDTSGGTLSVAALGLAASNTSNDARGLRTDPASLLPTDARTLISAFTSSAACPPPALASAFTAGAASAAVASTSSLSAVPAGIGAGAPGLSYPGQLSGLAHPAAAAAAAPAVGKGEANRFLQHPHHHSPLPALATVVSDPPISPRLLAPTAVDPSSPGLGLSRRNPLQPSLSAYLADHGVPQSSWQQEQLSHGRNPAPAEDASGVGGISAADGINGTRERVPSMRETAIAWSPKPVTMAAPALQTAGGVSGVYTAPPLAYPSGNSAEKALRPSPNPVVTYTREPASKVPRAHLTVPVGATLRTAGPVAARTSSDGQPRSVAVGTEMTGRRRAGGSPVPTNTGEAKTGTVAKAGGLPARSSSRQPSASPPRASYAPTTYRATHGSGSGSSSGGTASPGSAWASAPSSNHSSNTSYRSAGGNPSSTGDGANDLSIVDLLGRAQERFNGRGGSKMLAQPPKGARTSATGHGEKRPSSRCRTHVTPGGDKEDSSWSAAAASFLQLRLSKQLSD